MRAGRLFFADNKNFLPGIVVRFVNVRLRGGAAMQGGAFLNMGAMQVLMRTTSGGRARWKALP